MLEDLWGDTGSGHKIVKTVFLTCGASDTAIDNGMAPAAAAEAILAAIEAGKREIVLATGMEYEAAVLRRKDPEALFDAMSAFVRAGYAQQMATDKGED